MQKMSILGNPLPMPSSKGKSSDARTYEPSLGPSCVKRFEVFPHQLSLVFFCEDLPLVSSNIDKKCVLPDLSNSAGFPHHAGLHVKASYCVSAVLSDLQMETFLYKDKFKVYIGFHFFSCHNDWWLIWQYEKEDSGENKKWVFDKEIAKTMIGFPRAFLQARNSASICRSISSRWLE